MSYIHGRWVGEGGGEERREWEGLYKGIGKVGGEGGGEDVGEVRRKRGRSV